jgi:hypothetical protein
MEKMRGKSCYSRANETNRKKKEEQKKGERRMDMERKLEI